MTSSWRFILAMVLAMLSFNTDADETSNIHYDDCTNRSVATQSTLPEHDAEMAKPIIRLFSHGFPRLTIPAGTFDSLFVGPTGTMHIINSHSNESLSTTIIPLSTISTTATKLDNKNLRCLLSATLVESFYLKDRKDIDYSYYLVDEHYVLRAKLAARNQCTDRLMKAIKNDVLLVSRQYSCDSQYQDLSIFVGTVEDNTVGTIDIGLITDSNIALAKAKLAQVGIKIVEIDAN